MNNKGADTSAKANMRNQIHRRDAERAENARVVTSTYFEINITFDLCQALYFCACSDDGDL